MKKELLSFLIAFIFVFGIIACSNNVFDSGKASMLDYKERAQLKNDLEKVVNYINSSSKDKIIVIEWNQ